MSVCVCGGCASLLGNASSAGGTSAVPSSFPTPRQHAFGTSAHTACPCATTWPQEQQAIRLHCAALHSFGHKAAVMPIQAAPCQLLPRFDSGACSPAPAAHCPANQSRPRPPSSQPEPPTPTRQGLRHTVQSMNSTCQNLWTAALTGRLHMHMSCCDCGCDGRAYEGCSTPAAGRADQKQWHARHATSTHDQSCCDRVAAQQLEPLATSL